MYTMVVHTITYAVAQYITRSQDSRVHKRKSVYTLQSLLWLAAQYRIHDGPLPPNSHFCYNFCKLAASISIGMHY